MATPLTMRTPQDGETPPRSGRQGAFAYRYAYARSADCQANGEPGQDYLAFRADSARFCFALCDGVSQSFFGDLGARLLGDALLDWLDAAPIDASAAALTEQLDAHLRALTTAATAAVDDLPLDPELPALLRSVLEQKRASGSDATFVCGRIDLPDGDNEGAVLLAWLGDSRLRLRAADGEPFADLGDSFHTEQRWSSKRGPVGGPPHVFRAPLSSADRGRFALAAYSDGLPAFDTIAGTPSTAAVEAAIEDAATAPTSDDISLLELWLGEPPTGSAAPPLPAPEGLEASADGDLLNASWPAVTGAERYRVELRNGRARGWDTTATSWQSPPLAPGEYALRVRAYVDEQPSEWSAPVAVLLAALAAPPAAVPSEAVAAAPVMSAPAVAATAAPAAVPPRRRSRRRPLFAAAAAIMLLALVGAGGFALRRGSSPTATPIVASASPAPTVAASASPPATSVAAAGTARAAATTAPSASPSATSGTPAATPPAALTTPNPARSTATPAAGGAQTASATAAATPTAGVGGANATATPSATPPPATSYTVQANDNLWSIAARLLGDPHRWPALYDANRDQIADPNLLHVGQVLRLP